MVINIKDYTCLEEYNPKLLDELEYKYNFVINGEALEFFSKYPSLQLSGCALLKSSSECNLTEGILISDFLGIEQIIHLKEENLFDPFNYLLDCLDGNLLPLSLSMGESQLIVARVEKTDKIEIYVLDDLRETSCYICDGIFNFINNYIDHEFTLD